MALSTDPHHHDVLMKLRVVDLPRKLQLVLLEIDLVRFSLHVAVEDAHLAQADEHDGEGQHVPRRGCALGVVLVNGFRLLFFRAGTAFLALGFFVFGLYTGLFFDKFTGEVTNRTFRLRFDNTNTAVSQRRAADGSRGGA